MNTAIAKQAQVFSTAKMDFRAIIEAFEMFETQLARLPGAKHPWTSNSRQWHRAIWVEAAEIVNDHSESWKWWKSSNEDIAQIHLEICDILHLGIGQCIAVLGMSHEMVSNILSREHDDLLARNREQIAAIAPESIRQAAESFALSTLKSRLFHPGLFCNLMVSAKLSVAELRKLCIGKLALNLFRLRNGYLDGTYSKTWGDGRSDNAHLADLVRRERPSRTDLDSAWLLRNIDSIHAITSITGRLRPACRIKQTTN